MPEARHRPGFLHVRGSELATTQRLSMALLRMKITSALRDLNAACEALNYDAALLAQREMDNGLDALCSRFKAHAR